MNLGVLTAKQRKMLKELTKKTSLRKELSLYVVEGPRMCSEIPDEWVRGVYVTQSFLSQNTFPGCRRFTGRFDYHVLKDAEMKEVSDTVAPQGIMVLASMKEAVSLNDFMTGLPQEPLILFLDDIADPGNLGTIFRCAEAGGVDGIIMSEGCADVYSPKVVRSTMGSLFRIPFAKSASPVSDVMSIKSGEFTCGIPVKVYASDLNADKDYTKAGMTGSCMIIVGNEARGIRPELISCCTERILIPMKGQVESLNAAMAAAVMVFEAMRQRNTTEAGQKTDN